MVLNTDRHCCETSNMTGPISLSTNSAIMISSFNSNRSYFSVFNDTTGIGVWVILSPSSGVADKKGIFISGKKSWEMPTDNIYIGEIWAIADADNPNLYITEMC